MTESGAPPSRYDRQFLLHGPKRNAVLELAEVNRYGNETFDDPDYTLLYGLRPGAWFERGVRLLGRTVVECTRDPLADAIGREIAAAATSLQATYSQVLVIDPFVGSGNTLYWIQRYFPDASCLGFERDPVVFELTRRNLSLLDLPLRIEHADCFDALERLDVPQDTLVVTFIAPPWGSALGPNGLDLRETTPPVAEIADYFIERFAGHSMVFAIQIYERMIQASVDALVTRFEWWTIRNLDFNAPGQNSGVLLATLRA